jgi:hypothetical protein
MSQEIAPQTAQDAQDVQATSQESAPVSEPAETPESAPESEPEGTPEDQADSTSNDEPGSTVEPGAEPAGEQKVSLREHLKLRKQRQEAERRAAYWEGRAQNAQAPAPSTPTKPEGPPPFTPLEEYDGDALVWAAEKAKYEMRWELEQQQKAAQSSVIDRTFNERCNVAAKDIPDLNETINTAQLPIYDNAVVNAVKKSELGPQIVYYLAKNPAEAAKLAQMDPGLAIMEIGSIREKAKALLQPKLKKMTNAPAPINPGNGSGSTITTDLVDKDMKDYFNSRNEETFIKVGGYLVKRKRG